MSNPAQAQEHVAVEAHGAHQEQSFFTADVTMVILTWTTFLILLVILKKYAWTPILSAIEAREKAISKSVEDADKIKDEMQKIQDTTRALLKEAEARAQEIVVESRQAAKEAAKGIEQKAREEALIILQNARREIQDDVEKARADLKEESARIAIELAGKIMGQDLDEEKNKHLISRFVREI